MEILTVKVRNLQSLPALRYLVFYSVLHICTCPGDPYLIIESTDSMVLNILWFKIRIFYIRSYAVFDQVWYNLIIILLVNGS